MSETTAKKDTAKLQRAIVDGLEDVKAQDIQVFDTEHLSSLFERVIIASGTSNRQTKGLAASVRDAVREAGFPKPRTEGEDNGEWIIVDCGQCVAHIMQPAIRQYYRLEEIWGEKPVRMKLGVSKPAMPSAPVPAAVSKEKTAKGQQNKARAATKSVAPKTGAGKAAPAKRATAKPLTAKTAPAKTAPAKKTAAKSTPAKKVPVKVIPAPKAAAKKSPVKKAPAKKSRA
jgi:ribosome-associated protein